MLTAIKDRVSGQKQKPLARVVLEPGAQMGLDEFFEKWIPKLYGVQKHPYAVQTGTDFRTGLPLYKTWRQICFHEIEAWCFNRRNAHNWGSRWESAPESAKRLAYFMNFILEEQMYDQTEKIR
jgi:hypothetical protein